MNNEEIEDLAVNLAGIQPETAPSSPSNSGAESENQLLIRKHIFAIQQDASLTPADKARKIQLLMMPRIPLDMAKVTSRQQRTSSSRNSVTISESSALGQLDVLDVDSSKLANEIASTLEKSQLETADEEELVQLFGLNGEVVSVTAAEAAKSHHEESHSLGCEHYQRNCKMLAECCGSWTVCRLCHDEVSDHMLDRHAVKSMMCMHCQTCQPAAQDCEKCGKSMAKYYCNICHLWDNDPEKHIYHCDKCGLCRIGNGLGKDYFHCDKCNICMAISLEGNHKCIERNLECDCPICGEYMFTSMRTVIFMPCGHCIHHNCYQEHVKNSYQCPICWKSLADMTSYFRQIDRMLDDHRMPPEYENYWSLCLCNDCEKKSKTKYHFLYHKCQECGGYNTKILETYQEREGVGLVLTDTPQPQLSVNTSNGAGMDMLDMDEMTDNSSARLRSSSGLSAEATSPGE